MKKLSILLTVLTLAITIISCGYPGGSLDIKHSQYSHYYEMTAKFNPDKTTQVDRYLDRELSGGDMVFVNTRMDGEITLDNKTTFYIKKSPGYLNIKFDKVKNSDEAYVKVKAVLDRIGEVVR